MQTNQIQRQRENFTQQIRKTNRQEIFSKRRNLNTSQSLLDTMNLSSMEEQKLEKKPLIIDESRRDIILSFINDKYSMDQFAELVSNIHNQNIDLKHRGVIGIRKLISVDYDPPIQQVIDAQLIPILIQMSKQSVYPQLQLQATWIMTNVCSGNTTQCQTVIDKGGIPIFIRLLIENHPGVVDQAVWAIGNLSGDCVGYRDKIISAGAIEQLIKIVNTTTDKNMIRQIAWTLSNLCRGIPLPKYDLIKDAISQLCLIVKSNFLDKQSLIDSLWAISYGCESQKSKIQRVVETGVVQKLIQICYSEQFQVITPTLRILGNISVGNELQTQQLLKYGILKLFQKLIEHDKKQIRREACWIISNITAGTKSQIDQFMANYFLVKKVLDLFERDCNEVKRQICYIFSNMTNMGDKSTIFEMFMNQKIIDYYARILLDNTDVKTLEIVIQTLTILLSIGDKVKKSQDQPNVLVNQLTSIPGIVDVLEKLQYHESKSIYIKTVKLLQKHFDLEQELDL